MKTLLIRILALLLVACMLLPLMVRAAEVTDDGHVIAQPELLEQFDFPDDWSADALRFCVGNGILKGRNDGLAPGANITRAETAAILVRLLGAVSAEPDLSRFTDADPAAWYYPELAAAVEQGILKGTGETTLNPDGFVTREQAVVMLSRAFGIHAEDPYYWKTFADSEDCAGYARYAVSALAEQGILKGYPDGTFRPAQPITRAQMASLLYGLVTAVCGDGAELPETAAVLYRGAESLAEGLDLPGSLTLGCGQSGEIDLSGLMLGGKLILRPQSGSTVTLTGCRTEAVVCAADDMTLVLTDAVDTCVILGANVTVTGPGTVAHLILGSGTAVIEAACGEIIDQTKADPLKEVETLTVWDIVTEDTALYSYTDLTGWKRDLPAGTRLRHYYYREGNGFASVYTEDGRFGFVDIDCIQIPTEPLYIAPPYSREIAEGFVNAKGYDSSTRYMIWVSLKTQTVNVFEGEEGNWTLIRSMPCASGKNSTPTCRGEFSIQKKLGEWDFGSYKVKNVTVFYEGYAFHSRIYNRSYTQMLDDAIGYPASDGCLRMLDEDCRYIVDEMPYGTRVVVY